VPANSLEIGGLHKNNFLYACLYYLQMSGLDLLLCYTLEQHSTRNTGEHMGITEKIAQGKQKVEVAKNRTINVLAGAGGIALLLLGYNVYQDRETKDTTPKPEASTSASIVKKAGEYALLEGATVSEQPTSRIGNCGIVHGGEKVTDIENNWMRVDPVDGKFDLGSSPKCNERTELWTPEKFVVAPAQR
jgi:hypothetical protein